MKSKFKINDLAFLGDASMSKYFSPSFFEWYRGPETVQDKNLVFFTDVCLPMVDMPVYKTTTNIAIIIEPIVINPSAYQWIQLNWKKFKFVLSHHNNLKDKIGNFVYYPSAMSWVAKEDWKVYNKTKNINIIASDKNYVVGHKLRHDIVKEYFKNQDKLNLDILGKGYSPFKHKIDALKDYRFSITIENCQEPGYFTEKLIDCFATGTVPIYWGSKETGKFFNPDGIIFYDEMPILELASKVDQDLRCEELYNKKFPAIKENIEIAKNYCCAEDWIMANILEPMHLV